MRYRNIKRLLDIIGAVLGLIVWFIPMLIISVAVRINMGRPVLFRQKRLGRDGRSFQLLKFRSMVVGAWRQGEGLAVAEGDPRITRLGKILRQSHVDELPQLVNVLRGEMSIIGPRATLPFHYDYYEPWETRRLDVRPGITGWAQINGGNSIDWNKRIELDVWYVENMSFKLDFLIFVRTLVLLLKRVIGKDHADRTTAIRLWTRGMPDDPFTNSLERVVEN